MIIFLLNFVSMVGKKLTAVVLQKERKLSQKLEFSDFVSIRLRPNE